MQTRRSSIAELVNQKGKITFKELKEAFPEVSEMTLRRDLECLDQEKKLVRIHGGAKSIEVVIGTEDLFTKRSTVNIDRKRIIVSKALTLLAPNTSFYLDSGSTTTELARAIPDEQFIIFTGSISCALELARLSSAEVNVLGGRLNTQSLCLSGSRRSIAYLDDLNFSLAFMGATGYSTNRGFTCGHEYEYELKKAVVNKSEKVVVLLDSSKIGIATTYTFAELKDVDIIISDDTLPQAVVRECQLHGVEIL